jgi:lipopolysaccharide/colanic/teichoic acid biosynthesis glycosyltransferase
MGEDESEVGKYFPNEERDSVCVQDKAGSNLLINNDYKNLAQYLNRNTEIDFRQQTSGRIESRDRKLLNIFQNNNCCDKHNGRRALHSEELFRTLVLHECARCDRNSHQFSLIQVDLGTEPGRKNTAQLIRKVLKRIRTTDEAGWLSGTSLGIFLPETELEGAAIFARSICNGFAYQVYTYPDFNSPKKNKGSRSHEGRSPGGPEKDHGFGQDRRRMEDNSSEDGEVHGGSASMPKAAVTQEVESILVHKRMPAWKRLMDIIGSIVALVLFSPLLLLIAFFIKVVSRGPVLYRQERVGYLGRPFTIWKFRTMKWNADSSIHREHLKDLISGDKVLTKLDHETDCRWIPLAGLLRKTCLDELPQLFNVLKGEMSLVGPRPVPIYEAEEYLTWQRQRFHALPGMTGLWQVSGKNRLTFSQMMRLDARYSKKCNVFMDFMIFIKTFPAIMGQVFETFSRKLNVHPLRRNVSVWRRSVNDLVRQFFL